MTRDPIPGAADQQTPNADPESHLGANLGAGLTADASAQTLPDAAGAPGLEATTFRCILCRRQGEGTRRPGSKWVGLPPGYLVRGHHRERGFLVVCSSLCGDGVDQRAAADPAYRDWIAGGPGRDVEEKPDETEEQSGPAGRT